MNTDPIRLFHSASFYHLKLIVVHLILPLVLLLVSNIAFSQPSKIPHQNLVVNNKITLPNSTHKNGDIIRENYQYLIDETFNLSFEQVQNSNNWQLAEKNNISRGVKPQAIWMRFFLKNATKSPKTYWFKYIDSTYETLTFYYRDALSPENNSAQAYSTFQYQYGNVIPNKQVASLRPTIPIKLTPNQTLEMYVQIIGSKDFAIASFSSFELWQNSEASHSEHKEVFILTALFCIQLFIATLAFCVYISNRQSLYFIYAVFAASSAISLSSLNGLWPYFIAGNGYQIVDMMLPLNIMHLSAFIFVTLLLNLKKESPYCYRYMQFWIIFALFGLIFDIIGLDMASRYMIEISAMNYLSLCVIALIGWKKGVPDSLLLAITWLIFTVGTTAQPLRNWGVIEHNFISQWLLYVGAFIETALLVIILTLKLKREHQERLRLEYEHRLLLENSAADLQQQVEDKTYQLQEAKALAEKEARTDILTNLPNRRAFLEISRILVANAHRNNQALHLIILDIDHFKKINDKHGHAVGDYVLEKLGKWLSENQRDSDIIARFGGEEFAILLSNQDDGRVYEYCERLRRRISQQDIRYQNLTLNISISIGFSHLTETSNFDSMFNRADQALYHAKNFGRNKTVKYSD